MQNTSHGTVIIIIVHRERFYSLQDIQNQQQRYSLKKNILGKSGLDKY